MKAFIVALFLVLLNPFADVAAQPPLSNVLSELHPALLTRYEAEELEEMRRSNMPRLIELNVTAWYSFQVEPMPNCTECLEAKPELVNAFLYEALRRDDTPVRVQDPKRGWIITLAPRAQLRQLVSEAR